MAKEPQPKEPGTIHRDRLWPILGLDDARMLDYYAKDGHLVRAQQRGWFHFIPSITAICTHLRKVAAGHSSNDGKHDVAAESAQLKAAQRRRVEMQLAREEGRTIDTEEAEALWAELVKDVRTMILSFPARVQGELPHMVASEVEVIKRISRAMLAELKALGDQMPRPQ